MQAPYLTGYEAQRGSLIVTEYCDRTRRSGCGGAYRASPDAGSASIALAWR
ncbi:hypothetical protein BH09ACT8_BH09ACT8_12040 [soil metagenome]